LVNKFMENTTQIRALHLACRRHHANVTNTYQKENMNSSINCSDKDSGKELVHARSWRASWDSCACWKVGLGRSCAVEAALLAPSKEASGLAVFEAIVGSGGIAVTASIADADFAGHATLELGMVDAAQAKGALATLVALVTECVVIQGLDLGLIIG